MKTFATILLMIIAISASSQDTTKVKKDSIQYVPVFEKYDTIRVTFEAITGAVSKCIHGYLIQKNFVSQSGQPITRSSIVMFLDEFKKPFKGRILQAWEYSYDLNPLNQIKADSTKLPKPQKPKQ